MTTSPGRGLLVGRTIGAGAVRRPPQPLRHRQLLNRHDDDALARLTDREREVLNLMAQGRSNFAISEEIHCSAQTLETHIDPSSRNSICMATGPTTAVSPP